MAIYYHGYTGSWMQGAYTLNMTVDAEKAGYLLIFGQGTPGPAGLAWEAGLCCIFNESTIVDDIAYTRTVIKLTQAAVNVDPDRVYAMGWSNGGYSQLTSHTPNLALPHRHHRLPLTHSAPLAYVCCAVSERLACEAPELFAAVAADASAVAVRPGGRVGLASCDKTFGTHTLNYLHFHGTADTAVPWTGSLDSNGSLVVHGTLENIARWVSRLDCDAAVRQTYNDYTFSNMVWGSCRGGRQVELMTVKNGVHAWWMAQSDHFATTTYVLDFFTKTHKAQSKGKGKGEKGVLGGLLDMFN